MNEDQEIEDEEIDEDVAIVTNDVIAKRLYETYCKAVGGKAFNGDPLPDAETFFNDPTKKKQADAWLEVGNMAIAIIVGGE